MVSNGRMMVSDLKMGSHGDQVECMSGLLLQVMEELLLVPPATQIWNIPHLINTNME